MRPPRLLADSWPEALALVGAWVGAGFVGLASVDVLRLEANLDQALQHDPRWALGWSIFGSSVFAQFVRLIPEVVAGSADKPKSAARNDDGLVAQLTEVNERGRQYGAQFWQIPFAYVGIVGGVLSQVADEDATVITRTLIGASIFGIPALLHALTMLEGNRRAVREIERVERLLQLTPTVRYKPVSYALPLLGVVAFTIAVCACTAMSLPTPPSNNRTPTVSSVP